MFIPVLVLGGLLLMAGGAAGKKHRPSPTPTPQPSPEEAEAITFCQAHGGTVSVMEDAQGSSFFMCSFPDGRMVEAEAFARGEAEPTCPLEMMYDPTTERCVPIDQTGPQPEPGDPNFEICMGAILAAWAPYTEEHYNLAPAVADNVYLVMRNAAEEAWAHYKHPEALADLGMTYVVPECDFIEFSAYIGDYEDQHGISPAPDEDMDRADEVYASVLAIAEEAMEDAEIPPDFHQGESQNQLDDQGIEPDQGGISPRCPPNYFYDALHDVCCPDGFYWNVEDQTCRPMGFGGLHNISALRQAVSGGYAGGCGGRRGHCGVRPRS